MQENIHMKCDPERRSNTAALARLGAFRLITTVAALFVLISPTVSQANPPAVAPVTMAATMTAPEADAAAQSGEIILLDIRTPEEWAETGIPASGHAVSMHVPGFLEKLATLNEDDKSKPIALICARGNRSAFLRQELTKRGFTQVVDVSEGMVGGQSGPGWIARGLAVKKPQAPSDSTQTQ